MAAKVDQAKTFVGPQDPSSPIGPPVPISASILRQEYADGTLYQLRARRGEGLPEVGMELVTFPSGVVASVHSSHDVGDPDDDSIYISAWVAEDRPRIPSALDDVDGEASA